MDDETQKIIADQVKQLPKDVREAIISVDYKTKLQEITKRQRLLIDQAAKLEMETTLVMIGLEPLADYVSNLQRELTIPTMRAKEIAMDVSENIFKLIRESLHAMNKQVEESDQINSESKIRQGGVGDEEEPPVTKFTNSNETNLNRDQILNEIENPATITGGDRSIDFNSPTHSQIEQVKPAQNLLEAKMTGTTVTSQQIVNAKPGTKLPEIPVRQEKSAGGENKGYHGVDPYREEIK